MIFFISCTKGNHANISNTSPQTYYDHQFKDKLTAQQIVERISAYIPAADTLLHTKYDVTVYRVFYKTHDYQNHELIASGLVYVPELKYFYLPVISYQHGTAIRKSEVPSITGDLEYDVPFMFASESGAIVCEADYIGLGLSEGVHHYFEPTEEANAVIDLMRSVETLFTKTFRPLALSKDLFLAGYSQGGHATLAAQRKIELNFSSEFNLKASAPMASFFSLEKSSQFNVLKDSIFYPVSSAYPYLINSINTTQHVFSDYSSVFIHPYDSLVNILFDGEHDAEFINTQFPNYIYNALQRSFRNEMKSNPDNTFIQAAKKYDVINDWIPKTPTHFYHSENDEIAFYDNSVIAYNTFLQKGGNVQLFSLGHVNHLNGNLLAIEKLREWFYPQIKLLAY